MQTKARMARNIAALLCSASVLFTAHTASAQGESESEVEARFNEQAARARELYVEGKLDEALEGFEAAYAIKPEPNILYNIGRIYEKKGDFEQATIYYERFVNEPDIALPARQDALARLKTLKEVLALREEPEPEPVEPEPEPPPAEEPVVTQPVEPIAPIAPPSKVLPTTLMGLGALGLVAGGVFGILTGQTHAEFEQTGDLEQLRALREEGRRQARIADASMIAGGALLTTGAILFLVKLRPSADTTARLQITPALGPRAQGLQLSWSFR